MRLPRDLSGEDLIKALGSLGYVPTRQTGSHIRLATQRNGEHHVTVPRHDPLRVGTLNGVLTDVGKHFGWSRDETLRRLFYD